MVNEGKSLASKVPASRAPLIPIAEKPLPPINARKNFELGQVVTTVFEQNAVVVYARWNKDDALGIRIAGKLFAKISPANHDERHGDTVNICFTTPPVSQFEN